LRGKPATPNLPTYLRGKVKKEDSELTSGFSSFFLNRHIENINKFEGVEWVTMETICDTWKAKNSPPKGALLPAEPGAILKDRNLKLKVQE
jgi:hypothetical protein